MRYIFPAFIIFIIALVSPPAQSEQNRFIKIATYIEPPFTEVINGEYVGETIDIVRLFAKQINKEPLFIKCPVIRCLKLIEEGKADMIAAIRKNDTRQQYLTYLTPPFKIQHFPLRFYIRQDSLNDIKKFEDLSQLIIGAIRGASYFERFDQDKTLNIVSVTTHNQLIQMLLKKRIDTFLEREESITPLIDQKTYQAEMKLASYQYDNAVGSYIAISKVSPFHEDIEYLSTSLNTLLNNGEIAKILNSYNSQAQ